MLRKTLAVSLLSFALPGTSRPQEQGRTEEPPAVFPVEIEQVTVDVVVTDDEGRPVTDLAETHIEIYEDGVRQTTTSFDRFEVAAPPPREATAPPERPTVRARVSSNADEEEVAGRTFVIVFDDVHLTEDTAGQARAAVSEFLGSETREGDWIALVAPGAGAWWNTRMVAGREELLEMLSELPGLLHPDMQPDRLSDYEAMRVHVFRDTDIVRQIQRRYATRGLATARQVAQSRRGTRDVNPALDPYILAKAARIYPAVTAGNQLTLEAMERALDSLVRRQGRKSMVVVSEGFIYDPRLDGFKRILTASLEANTAIYFLNSRGLQAVLRSDEDGQLGSSEASVFTQELEEAGGAVSLAQDSGGFFMRDTDDLGVGLRRIADETRAYYLIGYTPTNLTRDGEFRQIEVRVPGREGMEIRARRGYYAPSAEETASPEKHGPDAAIQEAMDSPYPVGDIGLRMTHLVREETSPGTARVSVAAEVDVEDLEFEPQEGEDTAALQFVMVAMNRGSGEHVRYDQKVDLSPTPETRSELARTWLPIVRDFELATGSYRVKMVLMDRATRRLGTVIHDFKVPDIDRFRFRVSTPVLSDMRDPTENDESGERLAIMARREFAPHAVLYFWLDVHGAARLESSGKPRVTMGYEVRRGDGALYTREASSVILPESDGTVSRMIGFSLEAATPGDYEIVIRVKDGLSGKTVDLREPFTVSAPAAGDAPVVIPSGEAPSPSTAAPDSLEPKASTE